MKIRMLPGSDKWLRLDQFNGFRILCTRGILVERRLKNRLVKNGQGEQDHPA